MPFVDAEQRPGRPNGRGRLRRGGPRTPLPLLGAIAIAAGIGVAYVNQTARATQATYQATALQSEQQQLSDENNRLGDQLSRLEASERIVAAAQRLGMRPAGSWSYVSASRVPVLVPQPGATNAGVQPSDPIQRLVASLGTAFGIHGGASGP